MYIYIYTCILCIELIYWLLVSTFFSDPVVKPTDWALPENHHGILRKLAAKLNKLDTLNTEQPNSNSQLVGGFNQPSEKYELVNWDEIPNKWKNRTCSKPPTSDIFQ